MIWSNEIINLPEALERVMGHSEMYRRWLDDFFNGTIIDAVKSSFSSGDYVLAHKSVHKLKGTAANLAITRLASSALNLDERIKSQEEFGAMDEGLEDLCDKYEEARSMFLANSEFFEKNSSD